MATIQDKDRNRHTQTDIYCCASDFQRKELIKTGDYRAGEDRILQLLSMTVVVGPHLVKAPS